MQAICHISLNAIADNYLFFEQRVKTAKVIPVVKANAYGHGAVEVTRHLHEVCGVSLFAVATLEEACELAEALPSVFILIFSRVFANELSKVPENAILSIGSLEDATSIVASGLPDIMVHLNINTGMNRLGLTVEEGLDLIANNTSLDIQGVYSHFSSSDTLATTAYDNQNQLFSDFVAKLRKLGYTGLIHFANSADAIKSETQYDGIRLGIGLYGYDTTSEALTFNTLKPAMEVKAPLIRVDRVRAGTSISYGEQWQASVDTNIGTLRIGYADGYIRALTNRGKVHYEGKLYPVVGSVTMDHIMVDLGDDTPDTGSYFTVLGGLNQSTRISTIASKLNTITYEVCCTISPRVKRIY